MCKLCLKSDIQVQTLLVLTCMTLMNDFKFAWSKNHGLQSHTQIIQAIQRQGWIQWLTSIGGLVGWFASFKQTSPSCGRRILAVSWGEVVVLVVAVVWSKSNHTYALKCVREDERRPGTNQASECLACPSVHLKHRNSLLAESFSQGQGFVVASTFFRTNFWHIFHILMHEMVNLAKEFGCTVGQTGSPVLKVYVHTLEWNGMSDFCYVDRSHWVNS